MKAAKLKAVPAEEKPSKYKDNPGKVADCIGDISDFFQGLWKVICAGERSEEQIYMSHSDLLGLLRHATDALKELSDELNGGAK